MGFDSLEADFLYKSNSLENMHFKIPTSEMLCRMITVALKIENKI